MDLGTLLQLLTAGAAVLSAVTAVVGRWRQLAHRLGLVSGLLPASYRCTPAVSGAGADGQPQRDWAVVTGGSRGIGRAFVRLLAADGWSLIIHDLDDAELDDAVAEAKRLGSPACERVGADAADVDAAVGAVAARCEAVLRHDPAGLRLVVGNLGVSTAAPALLAQHAPAEIDRLVTINALFAARLARALVPLLAAGGGGGNGGRGGGRQRTGLLLVSSAASQVPAAFVSIYASTKAFLNSLARAVRAEASGQGLAMDVLAVTPGYVAAGNTPRWVGGKGGPGAGGAGFASPEEVARASLLLLPTALATPMTPLLRWIPTDFCTAVLPDWVLAPVVFSRHHKRR